MKCPACNDLGVVWNWWLKNIIPVKGKPFRLARRKWAVRVLPCPICQYHPTAHIKLALVEDK